MHFSELKKNMVLSHLVGDYLFVVIDVAKDHARVQPAIGGKIHHVEPDHPLLLVVEPAGLVA